MYTLVPNTKGSFDLLKANQTFTGRSTISSYSNQDVKIAEFYDRTTGELVSNMLNHMQRPGPRLQAG